MLSAGVDLAVNLARVQEQIAEAAVQVGRQPEEITLVGVSKTHSAEEIVDAVRAGVRHIGENRVQEAEEKFATVRSLLGDLAAPTFHMVGHLQTNKVAAALELFDRIDSVDSVKLAQGIGRRAKREVAILVEVYVGDDPSRPGVRPDQLIDVVGPIVEVPGVRVQGLMTVAPLGANARAAFANVRELKETLSATFPAVHFGVLSMGMSDDYREAIAEGSTEVRIGTALFGPRKSR